MSYTKAEAKDRLADIKRNLKEGGITEPEAAAQRAYVEERLNPGTDVEPWPWQDPQAPPAKVPKEEDFKKKSKKKTKKAKAKAKVKKPVKKAKKAVKKTAKKVTAKARRKK